MLNGMFQVEFYGILPIAFSTHGLLYLLSDKYKFWAELEAYAIQLKSYNAMIIPEWTIIALTTKYKLNVSRTEVIGQLIKRLS